MQAVLCVELRIYALGVVPAARSTRDVLGLLTDHLLHRHPLLSLPALRTIVATPSIIAAVLLRHIHLRLRLLHHYRLSYHLRGRHTRLVDRLGSPVRSRVASRVSRVSLESHSLHQLRIAVQCCLMTARTRLLLLLLPVLSNITRLQLLVVLR
jgi:hypothetical protein